MTQSEADLESDLVNRLVGLGYAKISLPNMEAVQTNLRTQLGINNEIIFSDREFAKVLNHLNKGNVFQKAGILRDRMHLERDDGSSAWIRFLNCEEWCQNEYQVTTQVTVENKRQTRFDVTLLINGLPLVQIELKRRGAELKEAFNQINRYHKDSFWGEGGLFQYVQIFVISNGVDTKYYANNRKQDYKQTFFWAEEDNTLVTQLSAFTDAFLEKCHVSKMIAKYIVLHQEHKILMVLRPYQFYAVEAIVERVKAGRQNGYVWHTTGSGKTLTSFKASQVLIDNPKVDKVVFVVDRADLDYQTQKEFNHFKEGSINGTNNTKALIKQMLGRDKLIVTTIQKLNTAIPKEGGKGALDAVKDKRVVFIFDECHRSQFGDTHKRIVRYFSKAQLIGFTGTPILKENAVGKRTTEDLFTKRLHTYVITDAISDENVLRFSVEYWGKIKRKDGSLIDEDVSAINIKEFYENPERIENIVDWVIQNHDKKTHGKKFSAMMCVGSVDALMTYYETFKRKRDAGEHHLRVGTIFTFGPNEESPEANGEIPDPDLDVVEGGGDPSKRDKLELYVEDYNAMFNTSETVKDSRGFYTYYNNLSKRLKDREKEGALDKDRLDILLVVNMFLTGFDAKKVNTLYVDKNLKYHGLIQAFSRTNRTMGQIKSQGNIVCFRNLKSATDEAISLFSDSDADATILLEPYEAYVDQFNDAVVHLYSIVETVDGVNDLQREEDKLAFVKAFRRLMRIKNVLTSFIEFSFDDLDMSAQTFEDYAGKYTGIADRVRSETSEEAASIINEVDFELELIQRDEINVSYILDLLSTAITDLDSADKAKADAAKAKKKHVFDLLKNERQLRSKRDLIEKFIDEHMSSYDGEANINDEFAAFWNEERNKAVVAFSEREKIDQVLLMSMLDGYRFTGKLPIQSEIVDALEQQPSILKRKSIVERVKKQILNLVSVFDEGIGGS
ncbi:MAG: type I restriction endonuclease subunit R [Cognatishimia sp.]|uniref:type I restriction endonuclease subunit R n=1 Tax=Cognatishimia sp. TaxID=2211648 RepID=UPI003B8D52CA